MFKERALCAGATVESMLIQTLTEQLSDLTQPNCQATADEFSAWLREWASKFPTLDQAIDDSRDSL
jgi:hypothetical protein